jgi:uncharacterized protein (DUF58 family)
MSTISDSIRGGMRGDKLLQPEVLAGLATLELIARTAVEGFLIGLHRSPFFGFSQEFAEYRPYVEGDDTRFIDWNVYSRSNRMVIKRFLGETSSHLVLMLDASASMGFGSAQPRSFGSAQPGGDRGTLTKFRYAQILAASLAYLASRQHDAVGLMVFDEEVREYRPPSSRSGKLHSVLHTIDAAQPTHRTDLGKPFSRFREHMARRGMVAVISDFYCDARAMIEAVRPLAFQGQDVILFHVLDPQELEPQFGESTLLEDMETGHAVEISPQYMKEQYPQRLKEHIDSLRTAAAGVGADYVLLDTRARLDVPLRNYFLFRQRRR